MNFNLRIGWWNIRFGLWRLAVWSLLHEKERVLRYYSNNPFGLAVFGVFLKNFAVAEFLEYILKYF